MINLFRVLHVFFASMVIALFPIGLFMKGRIKKAHGTQAELTNIGTMMLLGKILGLIGGIGLLIMGGALVALENYKWFAFSEFPWLAWKQTIYVLILAVNFGLVVPGSKRVGAMIATQMAGGGMSGATSEIRSLFSKIEMYAIIMNLLTLTAMTLGISKGIF